MKVPPGPITFAYRAMARPVREARWHDSTAETCGYCMRGRHEECNAKLSAMACGCRPCQRETTLYLVQVGSILISLLALAASILALVMR